MHEVDDLPTPRQHYRLTGLGASAFGDVDRFVQSMRYLFKGSMWRIGKLDRLPHGIRTPQGAAKAWHTAGWLPVRVLNGSTSSEDIAFHRRRSDAGETTRIRWTIHFPSDKPP